MHEDDAPDAIDELDADLAQLRALVTSKQYDDSEAAWKAATALSRSECAVMMITGRSGDVWLI